VAHQPSVTALDNLGSISIRDALGRASDVFTPDGTLADEKSLAQQERHGRAIQRSAVLVMPRPTMARPCGRIGRTC
jgi:hypothetical protein